MNRNQNPTPPEDPSAQVQQLIRLLQTGQQANIELALQLAEALGNPAAFQQYLQDLLPIYQLAFYSTEEAPLDAECLLDLFLLAEIEVSGGYLAALPESIGQLPNIQRLNCSENQLQALPESIGQLQRLEWIDCNGNQLQFLPESIGQLQHLQELYCYENQLQVLPDSIGQMHPCKSSIVVKTSFGHYRKASLDYRT